MSFLYILECMEYALLCMVGGTDIPMKTTGELPAYKDIIVSVLGWLAVYLIVTCVILIVRIIKKAVRRKRGEPDKAQKEDNSDAVYGQIYNGGVTESFFYLCECASLSFLYNHSGKTLRSTGKKATKKEYLNFAWIWFTVAVAITFVVLLCVYL